MRLGPAGPPAGHTTPLNSRIESPSLAELAADRISELVFRGELCPGDRLIEAHLCERLGVSRAPVREGLRILEGSGLVTRRPRAGVSVIDLTRNDVFEILTFREGLERMAVEHLYRYTDDVTAVDTSRLDAALFRLSYAFEQTSDPSTRLQTSFYFHTELVSLCGNTRLISSYSLLTMQVKLCMSMNLRKREEEETSAENVARHQQLRDAVLCGDLNTALQSVSDHGHDSFVRATTKTRGTV